MELPLVFSTVLISAKNPLISSCDFWLSGSADDQSPYDFRDWVNNYSWMYLTFMNQHASSCTRISVVDFLRPSAKGKPVGGGSRDSFSFLMRSQCSMRYLQYAYRQCCLFVTWSWIWLGRMLIVMFSPPLGLEMEFICSRMSTILCLEAKVLSYKTSIYAWMTWALLAPWFSMFLNRPSTWWWSRGHCMASSLIWERDWPGNEQKQCLLQRTA